MQNLVNFVIFQLKKSLNCLIGKIQKVKKKFWHCAGWEQRFSLFSLQTTKRALITTRTAPTLFFYNLKNTKSSLKNSKKH